METIEAGNNNDALIAKYKKYIENIEWDNKTNNRKGRDKELNDEHIIYIEEFISDLLSLQSQKGVSAPLKDKSVGELQKLIDWTDWLGDMGWYKVKDTGRWEHDDETSHFECTADLVEHYNQLSSAPLVKEQDKENWPW